MEPTDEIDIIEFPADTPVWGTADDLGGPTLADQTGDQTGGMGAL